MEHTVDKQQMDSLKALADTNIEISKAKNALFELRENETEYLVGREEKALSRIQKVFDDSKSVTDQIKNNYQEVKEILGYASQLAIFIVEAVKNFKGLLDDFKERDELWREATAKREEDLNILQRHLKVESVQIANDKKNIIRDMKKLNEIKIKLEDERGTLDRAIKRLKEGKI